MVKKNVMVIKLNKDYLVDISEELGFTSDTLYLMNISKRSVEEMSFKIVETSLSFLHHQGASSFGKIITMFDGYNDIKDEVYEIKEVRKWVKGLFQRYPYFLYFINYSLDSHITLLSCVSDIAAVYTGGETLSPKEYETLGINPLIDIEPKQWTIILSEDLYLQMKKALIDYGQHMNDFIGAAETIKMINAVTTNKVGSKK
ncbi:hypothetical protein QYF56_22615 [Paenibacillus polymyxa]|uniref:hypothetical protein n=1 Tax=Paenibacillus polymyxa TaxID=1406 RepID=UPI0002F122C9|nr:hypothetical protein [Paenibacillus polymyxa]MDN4106160.1 hypothetical protein [Paenibacillus polymyxa]